ncbi:hypothetical protein Cob_v002040 [Colletotrichum orbiculare MAFF 240422]|uniref:Uncharacterized protein n=1 Tax=Colletotrichum orbiculare (strain 104-T / ATCC 96160 / CBS 514.97 / LARS 414 / MAFF 240422) TaxID=1213857 RepID=A0A484G3B7_COLOR|nr:hypothetical protein Cob_v002040 [Colletotrichum orbiculare MAFF 240422]
MTSHGMADTARAQLDPDAMAEFAQTPSPRTNDASTLRCCCGRNDCAFLKHSCIVLDTVEKDVHTAAKLGKALLARHEAYMADAERDRLDLISRIEQLEHDKLELQAENSRTVEENRNLLDQLEMLNTTVQDSDVRIQTLEASLLSSQQAVRRLESAAARAAEMERHIALLEQEQLRLQNTLVTTESEARTAMHRWRKAEKGISDLQEQLERMEQEALEERERHAEVLGRMERQREMEKELCAAAERLKGAAAARSITAGKPPTNVVSHFVRDLLQDNANLQLGMAELREMLVNSNDEIQALRDQLVYHQPVNAEDTNPTSTLRAELGPDVTELTQHISQELHIHHHYHVAEKTKPKKKRHSLHPTIFSPPTVSRASTPPPAVWRYPPATPVTSVTHSHKNSASTASMGPSNRCLEPTSPTWKLTQTKHPFETSSRLFTAPDKLLSVVSPAALAAPALHVSQPISTTIEEEGEDGGTEDVGDLVTSNAGTSETVLGSTTDSGAYKDDVPRRYLHRAVSHESIISLSGGLDIHTLKARPSQLTFRPLGGADAVFTGVTARSTISRGSDKRSDVLLRDSLAGQSMSRLSPTPGRSSSPSSAASQRSQSSGGLGRWVTWRPWSGGSSPSRTTTPITPSRRNKEDTDVHRAPGINQPGAIPGFQEYLAVHQRRVVPSKVSPDLVDMDALREGLGG